MNIENDHKNYQSCSILDIYSGTLDYEISEDIMKKLSRELGFSYDLYLNLAAVNHEAALTLLKSIIKQSDILLLVDCDTDVVYGYTLETERKPILNSQFMSTVRSLLETTDQLIISEPDYSEESTISSVILRKKEPIQIEEKYENKESNFIPYDVGVLLSNDELGVASCRLVLYVEKQPLYLPTSLYNSSTSRYKRATSNSLDALEVLILKIIEDFQGDFINNRIRDLHYRYRYNKHIVVSYEEYNTLLRTLRKMPTIIEDDSPLDPIISIYHKFESIYNNLTDKRTSYIWRCTALGAFTIEELVTGTCRILSDLYAPVSEYYDIRELLGSYISGTRIAEDIAFKSTE